MDPHLGKFEPGPQPVGVRDSTKPRNGHTLYGPTGAPLAPTKTPAARPAKATFNTSLVPLQVQTAPPKAKPPAAEPTPKQAPTPEPEREPTPEPQHATPSGWNEFWLALAHRIRTNTELNATEKRQKKELPKPQKKKRPASEEDTRIGKVAYGVIMILTVAVALLAFVLSFTMMLPAARLYGWEGKQAALFPLIIDVGAVGGTIMGAISAHPIYRRSGHQVLVLTLLASVLFNLVGHDIMGSDSGEQGGVFGLPDHWAWTGPVAAILIPVLLAYFIHVASTATKTFVDQRRAEARERERQNNARAEIEQQKADERAEAERLATERAEIEKQARQLAEHAMATTQPIAPVEPAKPTPKAQAKTTATPPPTPKPVVTIEPDTTTPNPKPEPKPEPKPRFDASNWTVDNITELEFDGTVEDLASDEQGNVLLGLLMQRMKDEDKAAQKRLGERPLKLIFPNLTVRQIRGIRKLTNN